METVQEIAFSGSQDLPPEFIRPENEQPRFTTFKGRHLEIPVIDFSVPEWENLVQPVFDASGQWGIFQIVNHGIPNDVIDNLQRVEKEVYAKDPASKSVEGYGSQLSTKGNNKDMKKGWVDHLFNKIWPPSAIDYRFWPRNPPDYRAAVEEYAKHLHEVVNKLLRCLSLGTVYNMKINYYPPCPRPELALGVPAHSDLCAITILVPNQVQGLQVFRDDHWYDVTYIPNALIIHIGDQIEILSNGKYKAVLHRSTVNKEKTRMSWPVFIEPPPNLEIGPYPKLVSDHNPPKYKTKKFSDYAYCKLNKIPQ
ncbi:flavonol synthase/flavanone 3-hydroxylase [Phtheirospermum japonicum]|uniref:Flavonol synthase/flavanone 3-hydroxylase n=1 Tax=Phtheirospermum japonicum TaxID=374723 RepID=A0A830C105_9LAMI|nr:flavonol synthase/flavanone 3-hydroxylase [Phtheirospermum japonicum]